MLLAYVDESGNTGPIASGGTLTYTLGCVLLLASNWPFAFDGHLNFRRRLKTRFGLPMRAEVKWQYLLRNSGPIRALGLTPNDRRVIFRAHLNVQRQLGAEVFAVVVDKRASPAIETDCFNLAWESLLQRLERSTRGSRSAFGNMPFMVIHDEGDNDAVRAWVRRSRRHLTAGSAFGLGRLRNPAGRVIDDPVARQSHHSYFIQTADLAAYAAFRSVIPPGSGVRSFCPSSTWGLLGPATFTAATGLRPRAAPGIVLRDR